MTIDEFVKQLLGKTCRSVVCGTGSGSTVGLGFGKRLRRVRPLSNPHLREEDRKYSSELELTVYCAWRLCHKTSVICGWRDVPDQSAIAELESLIGKNVTAAIAEDLTFDLEIELDGDIRFQIFCDVTNSGDTNDNYLFANAEEICSVGVGSEVSNAEKRIRSLRSIE